MIVYRSTAPNVIGVKAFWFTRLVVSGDALTMVVRPRDVVDAAGEWLAAGLPATVSGGCGGTG
jgi:hypothetical protein